MSESLVAAERETTIVVSDADELVQIWSAQKRFITKMRNNPAFTEVRSGYIGTTEFAEFTIPVDRWSPAGVKRTIRQSSEQKNGARERLAAARQRV